MAVIAEAASAEAASHRSAQRALAGLPDRCALDVADLAKRIGVDKLALVTWARADLSFARLLAAKIAS